MSAGNAPSSVNPVHAPVGALDGAMLDAIIQQLMLGAGDPLEDLSPTEISEERRHVTWWIEACHAAGYAIVPVGHGGIAAALPDAPTLAMLDALGTMPWVSTPIAHAYQANGFPIPKKVEAEQAFVLYRLLRFAISHGEAWRQAAGEEVQGLLAKIAPAAPDGGPAV